MVAAVTSVLRTGLCDLEAWSRRGSTFDGKNPARLHTHYPTILSGALVYEVMQDFYHQP